MKRVIRLSACLLLITTILIVSNCTNKPEESQANKPQATANPPAPSGPSKTTATGTLTANPNPIKVCDGSGSGITTLSWTSSGTKNVEVRVGKPNGDIFAQTGSSGSWTTAKWASNGMVFYLQDVSDGRPLTADNTIATVTVKVTNEGCP